VETKLISGSVALSKMTRQLLAGSLKPMAEARWLDEREQAAWRGLLGMHTRLTAELARRLGADSSLSYPDYEVLVALTDQPDGRLRLFELAERLGWEKSRLSHHIARMAERRLVSKMPCDTDRRGFFVAATPSGRRELEAAAPGHVDAVRELFVDRLSPDQLDGISRAAADVLGPTTDPAGS
jgi:DNA-binding MarR family transcriptional regulator